MHHLRKIFLVLLVTVTTHLWAGVSLVGQAGSLFQGDTTTQVPVGSVAILVADTDKTSHSGLVNPQGTTLSLGSYLGGTSDDLIVGIYTTSLLSDGVVGVDFGGTTLNYSGLFGAGDDLWLLWFPSIFTTGGKVGGALSFGSYRSDVVDANSGSDIAFVAPPDGSISSLYAYSSNLGFGQATRVQLSATSVTPANQAPTDVTLSVNSVNRSGGVNATVGTLATADPDSANFTYALVSGTGATDNALFNLSGAILRANNASALAIGSYSVRIQTNDGSGGTYAKAFAVTASYIGAYFGNFASGGRWALYVRANNTATYLAYLPARQSVVVTSLTVAANGTFTVTGTEIKSLATVSGLSLASPEAPVVRTAAASASYTLSGTISANGAISGALTGLGETLTGAVEPATGPAQTSAGLYTAAALGTASGATYTVVGSSGQAVVVTTSATSVDGATGTVGANGQLTATTSGNARLSVTINSSAQTVSASLTPSGSSTPITYAGLPDTVAANGYLSNLSVRAAMATGQTLIVGFVVDGGAKPILIRAAGPVLNAYGLTGVTDPRLTLYTGAGASVAQNDNWDSSLASTFASLGAFAFDAASKDAALQQSVNGPHTAQATATNAGSILVEAYDAGPNDGRKLTNFSARFQVGTGNNILIAGFAVAGAGTRQVLIRAVGPTLTGYGVTGVLADPQFSVYDGDTVLAANNDWSSSLGATFTTLGAFQLPVASKDAALVLTLQAGKTYTVQVSGVNNTTGEALVEIYLVP